MLFLKLFCIAYISSCGLNSKRYWFLFPLYSAIWAHWISDKCELDQWTGGLLPSMQNLLVAPGHLQVPGSVLGLGTWLIQHLAGWSGGGMQASILTVKHESVIFWYKSEQGLMLEGEATCKEFIMWFSSGRKACVRYSFEHADFWNFL